MWERIKELFKKKDYLPIDDLGSSYFECTPDNICKVLDVLDIKYAVTEISAIEKESTFFEKVETLGIRYKVIPLWIKTYTRVLFMSTGDELKSLLADILDDDDDFAFIATDDKQLGEEFFTEAQEVGEKLVRNGVFNMYFSTLIEEYTTTILINKEFYDVAQKRALLKEIEANS